MKAMILAAGLGKRMQPLTNNTPKPLLKVAGQHLIEYHLAALASAGIHEVVINTHWLAEQMPIALGAGEKWGINIHYSHEPELLETAGGIRNALPYLVEDVSEPFLLINGDVFFEWNLLTWLERALVQLNTQHAFLALVPNPTHHLEGDFNCDQDTHMLALEGSSKSRYTYSGVGIYRGSFFSELNQGYQALGPLLKQAIRDQKILGQVEHAYWLDVGTPERLDELNHYLART